MSLLEEKRFLHEDIERLEAAISDRLLQDPQTQRQQLRRDHEIACFADRTQEQSRRLQIVENQEHTRFEKELQALADGDGLHEFYRQLGEINAFHAKYPNTQVENLERAYRVRGPGEDRVQHGPDVDTMFSGEEAYGKYFDLTENHEQFLNLPGVKDGRRVTYLSFLSLFDQFSPPQCPVNRSDKLSDEYLQYISNLASYLESFLRRGKPLLDHRKILAAADKEFEQSWEHNEIEQWKPVAAQNGSNGSNGPAAHGTGDGIWCHDCEKEFQNESTYNSHLGGKKHIRAAKAHKEEASNGVKPAATEIYRTKERVIASHEFRVTQLVLILSDQRENTRVNVERRQGMTERERQQEHEALMAEADEPLYGYAAGQDGNEGEDDEEKIHNPLKLPLAWDGKPIPYWLYKLHGLGVEFPCEVCGNFVYMGRRAFDKHFNEARHIYGLKCLGITNTAMFREITSIEEANRLWEKLENEKKEQIAASENVVEMEDNEGHVMPEKVFYDLQKQGLI